MSKLTGAQILWESLVREGVDVVFGYPGSREITIAVERGEVQGTCGIGWTG